MAAKKIRGLDGLRAFALVLVFLCHSGNLECGWIGVQLFFVLSGFLITGILLREKEAVLANYIRSFYGRRALRIFPLAYAYLLIVAALNFVHPLNNFPHTGNPILYAFTFTYNFYFASKGFEQSPFLTHFWTLGVEEQFYIVWPFVVFFLSLARFRALLIGIVVAGPILRYATYFILLKTPSIDPYRGVQGFPTSHIDAFSAGALIAIGVIKPSWIVWALLTLFLFATGYAANGLGGSPFPTVMKNHSQFVWGYSLINLSAAFLICCVANGGFMTGLFSFAPLAYVGRISYGLYIIHYPLFILVGHYWASKPGLETLLQRSLVAGLALLMAGLSYRYFESPLARAKDRFFPSHGLASINSK